MTTGLRHFATSDGLRLAYADGGPRESTGPVLLCLPGLTRNSEDFDPVAARFTASHRVIRLDPRGRGGSDYDPDPANYAIPVETRDAMELMDHLGLTRAAILGTSRGGLLALAIAAVAPERLAGVMLVDIGPVLEEDGIDRILDYLGRVPSHPDLDRAAQALEAASRARFPGLPVAAWRVHAGRIWRELPEGGLELRYDPRLRDAFAEGMVERPLPDLWPFFDALPPVPLALLHGANSDILSAETAAQMQARRPELTLTTVADRGHVPFLDEPESVAAIADFLRRTAG